MLLVASPASHPLLPHPLLITVILSPTEDKIQEKSLWPRTVAEGTYKTHPFFHLVIGTNILSILLTAKPKGLVQSHCWTSAVDII